MLPLVGFTTEFKGKNYAGWSSGNDSLWINSTDKKYSSVKYHRKQTGLNHICFFVKSKKDVDDFTKKFLLKNEMATLYKTPKSFPRYGEGYYAVFFEDPDRVKIEVAHFS
jgi:catechol 2,3-dioxygenase-like lactoylglutathione lyase family enzyme